MTHPHCDEVEVEEHVLGLVLPSDGAPGIQAVVVAVQQHGQAHVHQGEAERRQEVARRFAADDSGSDGPDIKRTITSHVYVVVCR